MKVRLIGNPYQEVPVNRLKRKVRIPSHVRHHFLAFEKSGLSIRAYCRKEQISDWTFYGWRRRYLSAASSQEAPPRFEEIALPFSGSNIFEVIFPSGIKVVVNRSAHSATEELSAVLRTLSTATGPC